MASEHPNTVIFFLMSTKAYPAQYIWELYSGIVYIQGIPADFPFSIVI